MYIVLFYFTNSKQWTSDAPSDHNLLWHVRPVKRFTVAVLVVWSHANIVVYRMMIAAIQLSCGWRVVWLQRLDGRRRGGRRDNGGRRTVDVNVSGRSARVVLRIAIPARPSHVIMIDVRRPFLQCRSVVPWTYFCFLLRFFAPFPFHPAVLKPDFHLKQRINNSISRDNIIVITALHSASINPNLDKLSKRLF